MQRIILVKINTNCFYLTTQRGTNYSVHKPVPQTVTIVQANVRERFYLEDEPSRLPSPFE